MGVLKEYLRLVQAKERKILKVSPLELHARLSA